MSDTGPTTDGPSGLLLRATDLVGRPVVTIDAGEDVAEVKDVVFDRATGDLVGFTLRKRGFLGGPIDESLPMGRVTAIGRDAVMIASTDELAGSSSSVARAADDVGRAAVIGAEVYTEDGDHLGRVVDVVVDGTVTPPGTPDVVGYEIDTVGRDRHRALIPLPASLSVSDDRLVVPSVVNDFVVDDLVGLAAAVDQFRDRLAGAPSGPRAGNADHTPDHHDGGAT